VAQALSRVEEGGGTSRQVAKFFLPAPIVGWKSEGVVVGSYPVQGVGFPNRLPLEGTGRVQNFGL
jgi:hypothetical protein